MTTYTFDQVTKEHPLSGAYYENKGFEFTGKQDEGFTLKVFIMNLRASNFNEEIKQFTERHKLFEIAVHLRYIHKNLSISHMKPHFSKEEWMQIVRFDVKKPLI